MTADGRRVEGRALIGADGLRSRVRAQLFGEREPHMIGWVAHRTTVPMDQVPDGVDRDIVALWGGDGFHIVHYPLRHGTLFNIVTVFRTPNFEQRVDAEAYRAEVMETYAKAHPVMKALIDITDLDWRGRIADRDPIRHWHKGRVTILGDAAHAPLQSLAQGACMAIEDGVCLAELIAQYGDDFDAAFERLEAERAARTARIVFESRYMWTVFHPSEQSRAKVHARFRAMSRDDVWDALAWIYDGFKLPASAVELTPVITNSAFIVSRNSCSGAGETCTAPANGCSCIAISPSATTTAIENSVSAASCARGAVEMHETDRDLRQHAEHEHRQPFDLVGVVAGECKPLRARDADPRHGVRAARCAPPGRPTRAIFGSATSRSRFGEGGFGLSASGRSSTMCRPFVVERRTRI